MGIDSHTPRTLPYQGHQYSGAGPGHMHGRLMPAVFDFAGRLGSPVRVLDVGCGNGFLAGEFLKRGCKVAGIDLSNSGIEIARQNHPAGRFEVMAVSENMLKDLGEAPFDLVLS